MPDDLPNVKRIVANIRRELPLHLKGKVQIKPKSRETNEQIRAGVEKLATLDEAGIIQGIEEAHALRDSPENKVRRVVEFALDNPQFIDPPDMMDVFDYLVRSRGREAFEEVRAKELKDYEVVQMNEIDFEVLRTDDGKSVYFTNAEGQGVARADIKAKIAIDTGSRRAPPAEPPEADPTSFDFGYSAKEPGGIFGQPLHERQTGRQTEMAFPRTLEGEQLSPSGVITKEGKLRPDINREAESRLSQELKDAGQQTIGEADFGFERPELKNREARSAAEKAQLEADAELDRPAEALGIVPPVRLKQRSDKIGNPDVSVEHHKPDVEARTQAAHGIKREPLLKQIANLARAARAKFRAQEHIPNTEEFATVNELFRLLKVVPKYAEEITNRTVAAIIDPMGPKQLDLFERYVRMENQLAAVERGEPLRFGETEVESAVQYRDHLASLVAQTPEVRAALDNRAAIVHELVGELVSEGLLPRSTLA
ncbi:MAG: hypothetical protein ACE5FM_08525, partial [Methyloligellaceae bacterium]